MKIKIAQVIGLNTDQKAAQVVSRIQDEDNIFLAVLSLTCDDAFTKGRQTLSDIADFYFDSTGSASEKLTTTFKESQDKLSKEGQFDLLLASVSGKALYLIGTGEVEAYLKRAGQLSPLLTKGAPSQIISGFLEPGDRILLSTKSLVNFLGDQISPVMDLDKISFEEEISAKVGASESEEQGLAGLSVAIEVEATEQSVLDQPNDQPERVEAEEAIDRVDENKIFQRVQLGSLFKRIFPKSGRGRLILAVVLILIVLAGAGYKIKISQDQQKQMQFNQTLQAAKDDYNAALGLQTLNPKEAKSKLDSAKDKVNQALTLKPKDAEALNLKKQIEDNASSILQQFTASDFPLFLDLDLVKKNFQAKQMSLSSGKILLLDPTVKTLVAIDVLKKSNQILAGEEQLGDAKLASLNGSFAFVYSLDKGVLRVDTSSQKVTLVAKADKEWGQVADLAGFASNIYLLDSGNPPVGGQIWKYLPSSSGYSDKREYLTKGLKVDFSSTIRMQIESSVYVLKSGGEILRFTKGDKDNFSYEGLDKGVKDPKSIFVSSDTDNLYLLDSGNSRVLILTKTGSYKGQISGDKFATATDLVVDEKGKKVYLLEGSKIYSVDLK